MKYLLDATAVDVSRITGVPWSFQRVHQRGLYRPCIFLEDLDWWEQWRIMWAQVCGNFYIDLLKRGEK